jgi:hypothetical protein
LAQTANASTSQVEAPSHGMHLQDQVVLDVG